MARNSATQMRSVCQATVYTDNQHNNGVPAHLIRCVDIGTVVSQTRHHVFVALKSGNENRRLAILNASQCNA